MSYNRPKLSACASWNLNATTFANANLVGKEPSGIFVNTQNTIYVSDRETDRIMIWSNKSLTPTRILSGNLSKPWSLFVAIDGDVYVDNGLFHDRIDKWAISTIESEHVINVNGTCTGLFIDKNNSMYCSSVNHHRVLRVALNSDRMTTIVVAGTSCPGPVPNMLNRPHGIFVDADFTLYVADTFNDRIQRFSPGQLYAITVVGLATKTRFRLKRPTGVALDADGYLYIVDSQNHRIIQSTSHDNVKCVVGCSGESGSTASQLHNPLTMAFDSRGNIFVSDFQNQRIQKFILMPSACVPLRGNSIDIPPNAKWKQNGITVAGGNGPGNGSNQLTNPLGLFVDDDQSIYITDRNNPRIMEWKYGAKSGEVVGSGHGVNQLSISLDVIVDKERDSLIFCDGDNRRVVRWPRRNGGDTSGETIISNIGCRGLTMDENGFLYVVIPGKHEMRRYKMGESEGKVVAGGNGQGDSLDKLSSPYYIFVDRDHSVYVSDLENSRVMKWEEGAKEGMVVAGGNGRGKNLTQLERPHGVVVDQLGTVYVAEYGNHRITRWTKGSREGSVIVGGNGVGEQSNRLNYPVGLSFDRHGNLYVADRNRHRVLKFEIDREQMHDVDLYD